MKKIFIGLLIGGFLTTVVLTIHSNYLSKSNNKTNFSSEKELAVRYPRGYITKTIKIRNSLVGFSFDYDVRNISVSTDGINYNNPPIAYLIKNGLRSQSYGISFPTTGVTTSEDISLSDIDKDGTSEIVTEWMGYASGATGYQGLIIWKLDKHNNLIPFMGYPSKFFGKGDYKTFVVKNLKTGKKFAFPVASTEGITYYQSDSSSFRLFHAYYVWNFDAGESRVSPHYWKLQVFKFKNGQFVADKSWNKGKEYTTKEKIGTGNVDKEKIKGMFDSLFRK